MAGDRVSELETQLAAVSKALELLKAETVAQTNQALDRFAIHRTIAQLEGALERRDSDAAAWGQLRRALYDESPDGIFEVDQQTHIIACNRRAEVLVGKEINQLRDVPLTALFEAASGAALTGLLWSGFTGIGESHIVLTDGRRARFSVANLDERRRIVTLRDDSARHYLEQELQHTRRLASIGHLAGGVAQQVNNPLAVVQGRVELLMSMEQLDEALLRRQLEVIMEHCRRIAHTVENLQTFSRPSVDSARRVSVQSLIDAAHKNADLAIQRVSVHARVEPPDLEVFTEPAQFVQVLVNLFGVAAASTKRTLSLHCHAGFDGGLIVDVGAPDGAIEALAAPFPPSAGAIDPGRSLRLAICWALIRELGGVLRPIEDGRLRIELGAGAPIHDSVEVDRTPSTADSLRILVVDDEQLLCETVTWMLAEDGHRIFAAHSAEDALATLSREPMDLVLTDLVLPGMDGEALIRSIGKRWPERSPRIILTSGLLHRPQGGTAYLQKPFTRAQLREAINPPGR